MNSLIGLLALALTQVPAPSETSPVAAPPAAPRTGPGTVSEPAPNPPLLQPSTPTTTSWTERVTLSGVLFVRYSAELTAARGNFNELALDRGYLTSQFNLGKHALVLATLEAGDIRLGGNENFVVSTKFLYLEGKDLGFAGTFIRAGQVQTGWVPYLDNLWGYRVQGQNFADRWGYMTAADLGLAAGSALPGGYGSFQLSLIAGEGWRRREQGKRKEIHARLTLKPLASLGGLAAGLFVSGFAAVGSYDDVAGPERSKQRYIGELGLRSKRVLLAAHYFASSDPAERFAARYAVQGPVATGQGMDLLAVLNLGLLTPSAERIDLFGRAETLDPDTDVEDNQTGLLAAGASFRLNEQLRLLGDWERVVYGGANRTANETRVKLHAEAVF